MEDTKKNGNAQKKAEIFGYLKLNIYLCSVTTLVLTTPLSAGSKT